MTTLEDIEQMAVEAKKTLGEDTSNEAIAMLITRFMYENQPNLNEIFPSTPYLGDPL